MRVRRIGSFVSSNNSFDRKKYHDRVPVRLIFKHEKLENLADANLKSRIVMALQSLTVEQFIKEVLYAMKASRHIRRSTISIGFAGKSFKAPITFHGHDLLEKVFTKIMNIEESRGHSRNGSYDGDLKNCAAANYTNSAPFNDSQSA